MTTHSTTPGFVGALVTGHVAPRVAEPINYRAACADSGTSRLVYHVIDYHTGFASCGTSVPLGQSFPAADIHKDARCKKSLCARRFDGADQVASGVDSSRRGAAAEARRTAGPAEYASWFPINPSGVTPTRGGEQ